MSSSAADGTSKIFVIVGCGIIGIVGVAGLTYFLTRKSIKEPVKQLPDEEKSLEKRRNTSESNKNETKSTNFSKNAVLEVSSKISIELNKKKDSLVINTENVEFISVPVGNANKDSISPHPDKNINKEKGYREDEYLNQIGKTNSNNLIGLRMEKTESKKKRTKPNVKDKLNTSIKDRIQRKISLNNSREAENPNDKGNYIATPGVRTPIHQILGLNAVNSTNFNDTFFNLNDFQDQLRITNFKELNPDLSISLDRPLNMGDIQKILGNEIETESAGYIEEDSDDGNYVDTITDFSIGKYNFKVDFKRESKKTLTSQNINQEKTPQMLDRRRSRKDSLTDLGGYALEIEKQRNNQLNEAEDQSPKPTHVIKTNDELNTILNGKIKYNNQNVKYALIYEDKNIKLPGNDTQENPDEDIPTEPEPVQIIKAENLLLILKYLYSELHSGLIELSDNFAEERRKYFNTDHETYISIINYFLRKKEEFFLCVLSDVMSELNISQKVLDNTFYYFMNLASAEDDANVVKIREAYDKVYHAGIKYSIVPRNLNKAKLKTILSYQCEIYESLIKNYQNYEPDVIEIMVTDYVYCEYGYDREAIRAAINKLNIQDDEEFSEIIKRIESIQNSSFLNI